MIERILMAGAVALAVAGCAVEHRAVVVGADDACTRYGFTSSSVDYARCQRLIAEQRRSGRVIVGYGDARITADAQAACESYGVAPGSAQFDRCVQDEFAARRPS